MQIPRLKQTNQLNLRSFVYKVDSNTKGNNNQMKIHPPVELVMNESEEEVYDRLGKPVLGPTGLIEKKKVLLEPSLLAFDHRTKKTRKLEPQDGLIYYMTEKPAIGITSGTFGKKRNIRFLITVTVYSETYNELMNTLSGIYYNLEEFKKRQIGNEDIAVVVIFDGCEKLDETIEVFFEEEDKLKKIPYERSMRKRVEIFKKNQNKGYPNNSVYMYQMNMRPEQAEENKSPNFLTVFFAVKLQNAGKLSSHLWFLRGFCEIFNPYYIALIDCGTIPDSRSIYKVFQCLEGDEQIGGVCGYMGLQPDQQTNQNDQQVHKLDSITKLFLNIFCIQKAQKYEYSMAHILDKSFESLFGFIHVLPGAFSAYRWDALRKRSKENKKNHSILDDEYLVSCLDPYFQQRPSYNIQKANMFLAEDRILCLEIFTKKNYILKYLPDAHCQTDPVKTFVQLMKQRRRWINGSWFALFYVLQMYPLKIKTSSHSVVRKLAFKFSMIYSWVNAINAYIIISVYFVFLWMTLKELMSGYKISSFGDKASLDSLIVMSYLLCVFALFHLSLFYNKPEKKIYAFHLISSLLGIFMLIQFAFFIYICIMIFFLQNDFGNLNISTTQKEIASQMRVLIILTICLFTVPCALNPQKAFKDILLPLKDYLYYSPQYFHTLLIFAFCNINDLSWGTKGKDKKDTVHNPDQNDNTDNLEQSFLDYKISFVGRWVGVNMVISFVLGILAENIAVRNLMILVLGYYFIINLGIRSVCAAIENLKYRFYDSIIWQSKVKIRIPEYKRSSKELKEYIRNHLYGKMYSNSIDNDRTEFAANQIKRTNVPIQKINSIAIQNNNVASQYRDHKDEVILEFDQKDERSSDESSEDSQVAMKQEQSKMEDQKAEQSKQQSIHQEISALLDINLNKFNSQ